MRSIATVLMVVLAGCGGAPEMSPSGEPSPDASVRAEASVDASTEPDPSVAEPSLEASPSAPSVSASPATGLMARPLDSLGAAPLGYLEYLPPSYGNGEPSPLLVFLHGAGEAGDGSEGALDLVAKLGIPQMIADGDWPDDHPFVVLAPQYGTVPASDRCDVADDVARFLEFALLSYEVDPSRVYLTGISCGAIGIWDYLASYGDDVVAAAVPISGHAEWALEEAGCAPLTEVPVWAFHGAEDEIVPVVHIEGPRDQIRACESTEPAEMELTVFRDAGHDAWSRTYDLSAGHDIYAWMLEHTND